MMIPEVIDNPRYPALYSLRFRARAELVKEPLFAIWTSVKFKPLDQ